MKGLKDPIRNVKRESLGSKSSQHVESDLLMCSLVITAYPFKRMITQSKGWAEIEQIKKLSINKILPLIQKHFLGFNRRMEHK